MGISVRINDLCANLWVGVYSVGLEDSQTLNLDPWRSGRRCRGGFGVLDGGGASVPDSVTSLVIGKERSVE